MSSSALAPGRPLVFLALLALTATPAAAVQRQAFVTSASGPGNLASWPDAGGQTGLAAGDAICRARAQTAGLPNAATYQAWLSTATVDAFCHVLGLTGTKVNNCNGGAGGDPPAGPWTRRDGQPFGAKLADLTSATGVRVFQPLLYDETGAEVAFVNALAWTGTNPEGRFFSSSCQNWTSSSNATYGNSGTAGGVGLFWTEESSIPCDQSLRLICLEPGVGDVQRVPSTEGALVFLTSTTGTGDLSTWTGSGGADGAAGADAVCQARALAANLPNPDSFVAWMSDPTSNASTRLTANGPFVRLDGFPLAATKAEMIGLSGKLRTGLNVDELGHYVTGTISAYHAWTGTEYTGTVALYHCMGWTSALAANMGTAGDFDTARYFTWTSAGSPYCNQPHRLYCFSTQPMVFWDNFERGDTLKWSTATP